MLGAVCRASDCRPRELAAIEAHSRIVVEWEREFNL